MTWLNAYHVLLARWRSAFFPCSCEDCRKSEPPQKRCWESVDKGWRLQPVSLIPHLNSKAKINDTLAQNGWQQVDLCARGAQLTVCGEHSAVATSNGIRRHFVTSGRQVISTDEKQKSSVEQMKLLCRATHLCDWNAWNLTALEGTSWVKSSYLMPDAWVW